jgi:hypothetical protein
MDAALILAKTEKGQEELQSRRHGLSQRLRTVLVMVDGRMSVGVLLTRLNGLSGVQAALAQLVTDGFLSPVSATGASVPLSAPPADRQRS